MKVVLFCGGYGTRLREHSETIPKPMVDIGYRPIFKNNQKLLSNPRFYTTPSTSSYVGSPK